ncbi:MAG: XRE family transcriptional regulator [Betaproteobacteria bacterium]|nr:MAG: XRE family transcriptional regulator [Betaproteobacteria bacterium]
MLGIFVPNFHERLRKQRESLGFSQQALADKCGVAARSQRNYESGERSPDANYMVALAAAGADIQYILHGVTAEEKAMVVLGVAARLLSLGYPADTRPEAVMALLKAHPEIDTMWLLTGKGQTIEGGLNFVEKILVTNYRAASSEGKKALEVQAAFFAKNNEGTAALAAKSGKKGVEK